jgi:hypothetical protein
MALHGGDGLAPAVTLAHAGGLVDAPAILLCGTRQGGKQVKLTICSGAADF